MTTYTIEQIESEGLECDFYSMGAARQGWAMPNGDLVFYTGFGQIVCDPRNSFTANSEALRLMRRAAAKALIETDTRLGKFLSATDWSDSHHAVLAIATFDDEKPEIAVAVKFGACSATPLQVIKGRERYDVENTYIDGTFYKQKDGLVRVLNLFTKEGKNAELMQVPDSQLWYVPAIEGGIGYKSQAEAVKAAYLQCAYDSVAG